MKLLIDEMWSSSVARQLRRRGFDVLSVLDDPNLKAKPDSFLLQHCVGDGRAIVTENVRDFRLLAATQWRAGRGHAGIILTTRARFDRGDPRSIGRLVTALEVLLIADPDLTGRELWLQEA